MYTVMVLIKRKPGMSMEDFIAYYEHRHAPLGLSKVPNLKRYVRHFLRPFGNDTYATAGDSTYDVVTELGFDDEADFRQAMAYLADPDTAAIIQADEAHLFDRASIRFMVVESHETPLPARLA
jgi:uncharacterized protein (TIGR02118 family)